MIVRLLFLISLLCTCSRQNLYAQADNINHDNRSHSGVGLYPVNFYEMGRSIRLNYILTKSNHDFYVGFSTHINHDSQRWSNTNYAFRGNGVARKFSQFFHPNIGYSNYIRFAKDYPVSLLLNVDFQMGETFINSKWYTYNAAYNSSIDANDGYSRVLDYDIMKDLPFRYFQFTANIGFNIDVTKQIRLNGKTGMGIVRMKMKGLEGRIQPVNGYEFPIVYSVGINYIFRK